MTRAELMELMDYNEETGEFTSRRRPGQKIGQVVTRKYNEHIKMRINGKNYRAHRLAWLYAYGEVPRVVMHKNGDFRDNRICNLIGGGHELRAAIKNPNNKSGTSGVSYSQKLCKWQARFGYKGKVVYLGLHDHPYQAAAAVKKARELLEIPEAHSNQAFNIE